MRPPSVPRSAAANPQRWKSAAAASSTPTTNPKVVTACRTIRARGKFWTSMVRLLVRQPGYLREARGFASPPRDGFAIVDRSSPGSTVTDRNRLRPGSRATPEAYSDGSGPYLRASGARVDTPVPMYSPEWYLANRSTKVDAH